MIVNWHLHFLLKCHLNVTCLVVCAISMSIDVWVFIFLFFYMSHYTLDSKFVGVIVSIDIHFFVQVFVCQMSKTCKNFVKNTQCSSYARVMPCAIPHNVYVLTNFIWHSPSNPKCHVTFSKTKMNVNWHLHFLLKFHLNVICLVVHVISICKVSIIVWFFSSQIILHVKF